jgi:hypothetical protein
VYPQLKKPKTAFNLFMGVAMAINSAILLAGVAVLLALTGPAAASNIPVR